VTKSKWPEIFVLHNINMGQQFSTMKRLFSPCTRLRDLFESHCRRPPGGLQELNLDVCTEEFLSTESGFTYADLYAMLGNKSAVAWLTSHAAVARSYERVVRSWNHLSGNHLDGSSYFSLNADGKVLYALACSTEHLLEICDVVIRLLAASVVHSVTLNNWYHRHTASINFASLAYLMEQCQSLKVLTLICLDMDEDHCRVLGAYSRSDLEIVLDRCKVTSTGASALAEILGRNQGPTKLDRCDVDNIVLADGLRGNSRLKSLRPQISDSPEVADKEVLAIAGALRENKGLVDLDLSYYKFLSDETWNEVCDSLKAHPTLEVLVLHVYSTNTLTAPAVITYQMQALLNMLKVNTSIHTLDLYSRFTEHELYRGSIVPYLETNRLRPRVRAIQKTLPSAYRAKVLGRALLLARTDPNRFWILLSGNADIVAFQLTTATTTRATRFYRRFCKYTPANRFYRHFYKCCYGKH
jgi:hypothetical protein